MIKNYFLRRKIIGFVNSLCRVIVFCQNLLQYQAADYDVSLRRKGVDFKWLERRTAEQVLKDVEWDLAVRHAVPGSSITIWKIHFYAKCEACGFDQAIILPWRNNNSERELRFQCVKCKETSLEALMGFIS